MYKNVGKKIQTFGKIFAWMGIICCLVVGGFETYYGIFEDVTYLAQGLVVLILGPISSYLASLALVGFGKLVEDNESMRHHIKEISNEIKDKK